MVFSSIPGYVDPHPPNWHHQQPNYHHHHHAQANNGSDVTQLLPPLPPQVGGGSGSTVGSIRPGSMADRARLAKIPPPEAALKCPRCESTNTKFCYFNNYSLSQPRHFCKTCRRYWTRGGALRNVPVGGGCRRNNKKNKRSRSKSPSTTENNNNNNNKQILNNGATAATNSELNNIIGQLPQQQQPSNIPFMASLQNLSRYSFGGTDHHHMGFQIGGNSSGGGVEQWRLQQFPFLGSFESNSSGGGNSYPFHQSESIDEEGPSGLVGVGVGVGVGDIALGAAPSSSRVTSQMPPPVKMEENGAAAMNFSRSNHLSSSTVSHHDQHQHNNQFYSWTTHDMPGLASNSSTTHHLL